MKQYIDKNVLKSKIERRIDSCSSSKDIFPYDMGIEDSYWAVLNIIDRCEVKELDLDKLGEIARHLIAVKDHIEDMRLDKEEWFILEKIGYPERFKEPEEE